MTVEDHAVEDAMPCPAPECTNFPVTGDRFCEVCGTWLGIEGERPPSTGPLAKMLLSTGAVRLVTMIEKAEAELNDLCK